MSASPSRGIAAGIFEEFAYKPTADTLSTGSASSSTSAAATATVHTAASAATAAPMSTSSDSEEDSAWFKKSTPNGGGGRSGTAAASVPAAGARAGKPKVERAPGMISPGWMSKNDPSNAKQRAKNVQRAKAQRGHKVGGTGKQGSSKKRAGGKDSDGEENYYRSKIASRRMKGGGGSGGKGKKAAKKQGRRGGGDGKDESEESFNSESDSEDEESEGSFEDEEDSSEDDDDEPELTDASSDGGGDNGGDTGNLATAAVVAGGGASQPTLDANAAAILAVVAATDEEKKKARAKARAIAKAKASKAAPAPAASSPEAGAPVGGGGKRSARMSGGRSDRAADVVASAGNGAVKKEGSTRKNRAKGSEGGGAFRESSIVIEDERADEDVDEVKLVEFKVRGSASSGGGGDGGRMNMQKKRRRVVDESDEDSSGGDGEVAVVKRVAASSTKKKHKKRYNDDDDMDDSDRGSDTDADAGARARKVLTECSALSQKLADVISKWIGEEGAEGGGEAEGEGAGGGVGGGDGGSKKKRSASGTAMVASRGALEISSLKGGGKSVTTNEEISEACPGLKLNPYQLVGVNWMCLLRETGVNGVLADEMGLGKTVQTIAFFALLQLRRKGAAPRRPHLVVVPSSVLDNWASELEKFCPALYFVKYHGSQKDRSSMRHSLSRVASGSEREGMPDIILTTYVVWERENSGDDRAFLKRFRYDYMVLDEGHSIKNIKSSRFQRLRVVSAKHRLLLSGTPVQNNLGELLALLSFLMPDIFRSDVIETLLEFLGDNATSPSTSPSASSFQVREVRGMLAPFVLRRLKAGVLKQLVAKTESVEKVPLSKVQQSLYDSVLENHVGQKRAAIERALAKERVLFGIDASGVADIDKTNVTRSAAGTANGGDCGGLEVVGADGDGDALLEEAGISVKECKNIFTELRKGANHPLMLLNHFKGGGKLGLVVEVLHRTGYFGGQATKDMVAKEVSGYSDFDLHQVCSGFDSLKHLCLSEETLFTSAKMERLRTLVPELVSQGHRILLFSQWTRLLDLLEVLLGDSMGLTFCRLDGSTPVSERKALIDKFTSDTSIPVFLLSTRAGGLGINLTAADTVILHDVDFNPENDRQAEDRCHRIGQTKPVTVIRMVAAGTVDEDIYLCGERKKEINESVLNDSGKKEKDAASTISGILKRAIQVHMQASA